VLLNQIVVEETILTIVGKTEEPFRESRRKWLFSPGMVAFYFRNGGFLKPEWVAFLPRIMHTSVIRETGVFYLDIVAAGPYDIWITK
jgi:hypothetical protein